MRFMLEYPLLCDVEDGVWLRPESMVGLTGQSGQIVTPGVGPSD